MPIKSECVAGFGHLRSLWFLFDNNQMVGYVVETPEGRETYQPDMWSEQHFIILKTTSKHPPQREDVLPYLSQVAGNRAVQAIKDYNVYELALAFATNYSWQLINGAKILPDYGELAKVYAGIYSVYIFKTKEARDAVLVNLAENWKV